MSMHGRRFLPLLPRSKVEGHINHIHLTACGAGARVRALDPFARDKDHVSQSTSGHVSCHSFTTAVWIGGNNASRVYVGRKGVLA